MYEGDCLAQAHPRRARLPAAERARQPAAEVGRVQGPRRPDGLPLGDARPLRDGHRRRRGRADHPPDRARRPADRRQAVEGADRRPARGDPHARRARRARARHDAHQEDGRGAHRLPRRGTACGCATCTPTSTPCAASSCSPSCAPGVYDVLVGINLLREGLDLPEVSLVAILDADKEGFLRSSTSLIQTIGRAARNVSGEVHMYADVLTDSMKSGDRRDRPAPREAGRLQPRARHRPAAAAQAHRRHHRGARARRGRHRRSCSPARDDAQAGRPTPNLRREGIAAAGRERARGAHRRPQRPDARRRRAS